jgi:repressor LexA
MTEVRKEPTAVQKRIFEFIKRSVRQRAVPPSIKEIGKAVGLSSSSSVHHQLQNLENLGLIRRDRTKSRCISIIDKGKEHAEEIEKNATADPPPHYHDESNEVEREEDSPGKPGTTTAIETPEPAALNGGVIQSHEEGEPKQAIKEYALVILSQEGHKDEGAPLSIRSIPLPVQFVGSTDAFLLEMQGDGMKEAAILDGDLCIIKHQAAYEDGDTVAVKIDEEVSIKKVFKRTDYYILESENHRYKRIIAKDPTFLGKVIGILRNSERKRSWLSQEI